jgi:hypothetical protein
MATPRETNIIHDAAWRPELLDGNTLTHFGEPVDIRLPNKDDIMTRTRSASEDIDQQRDGLAV